MFVYIDDLTFFVSHAVIKPVDDHGWTWSELMRIFETCCRGSYIRGGLYFLSFNGVPASPTLAEVRNWPYQPAFSIDVRSSGVLA